MTDAEHDRADEAAAAGGAEIIAFPGSRRGPSAPSRATRRDDEHDRGSARRSATALGVAAQLGAPAGPRRSLPWSDREIPSLPAESEADPAGLEAASRAEDRAVAMLRRADRSSGEMRAHLAADESLGEAEVEGILERLEALGYLDDGRLAEMLVEKHLVRQAKGRPAVERLLRDRGLDADAIEAALAEHDRDDEFERARASAESRATKLRGLDDETAMRRLASYLQRRGFTSGVAFRAAEEALRPRPGSVPRGGSATDRVRFAPADDLG